MCSSNKALWYGYAKKYGVFSAVCLIIGAVYECFSHGVLSLWMMGMFLWPLSMGVFPCLVLGSKGYPLLRGKWRYRAGVITWTIGSGMEGVFEIYGTHSPYLFLYWVLGGLMLLWAMAGFFHASQEKNKEKQS